MDTSLENDQEQKAEWQIRATNQVDTWDPENRSRLHTCT